jgi:hypothetical protein
MLRRIAFVLSVSVFSVWVLAQMAPRDTVVLEIGGAKITVEYGRPSLKGRSFDELASNLPSDRMWRAGAEQITTLTAETAVMIGAKTVPPGKYSLYVHCPKSGPFSLALNRTLGQPLKNLWSEAPAGLANEPWPHMDYQKITNTEVARIPLKKTKLTESVDLFTINLAQRPGGGELSLAWGKQVWSVGIKPARAEGSYREGS